jgi:hypothetical protein
MPSQVPLVTGWPDGNAIDAAMQVLATTNPAVYAFYQLRREALEDYVV